MTDTDKVTYVTSLCNDPEATEVLVNVLLTKAKYAILRRKYLGDPPAGATLNDAEEDLQCQLAARYFFRRGAEGEVVHNENGINRTYGSANDEDLLCEVTTVIKVV